MALVLAIIALYLAFTQWPDSSRQAVSSKMKNSQLPASTQTSMASKDKVEPVDVLLIGLKKKLEKQPNDVDGWVLLSKSYYHLNRMTEAQQAFEQAVTLGYAGNWKPLPRIDSAMQNGSSSRFKATINFRDYRIDEETSQ